MSAVRACPCLPLVGRQESAPCPVSGFGVSGLPASAVTGEVLSAVSWGGLPASEVTGEVLSAVSWGGLAELASCLLFCRWLSWVLIAGGGLLASCRVGLLPAVAALPCAAGLVASGLWSTGLYLWRVGSSPTRGRTRVSCLGTWILYHGAMGEDS